MNDEAIEDEIQAKGLNAPRVTPASIEAKITSEHYFTAQDGVKGAYGMPRQAPSQLDLLTICVLVMENGFTVMGNSACASPENFDAEIGKKIARADAVNQLWPLEGYLLRQKLSGPL